MCKPPSLEDAKAIAEASANAYCDSLGKAVKEGIKEWKRVPEVQKPKSNFVRMSCDELCSNLAQVGTVFEFNPKLKSQLKANGLDGMMLSYMSDEDIEEFFIKSCEFEPLQARMLLAKIKAWQSAD
jgi:hypothetical protein